MRKTADSEKRRENVILPFDAAAYRRLYLRWLLACIFVSLLIDGGMIYLWQTGLREDGISAVFIFFVIINLLVLKAYPVYRYLHIRRICALSFVRLEKRQVVHYQFIDSKSCRRAQWAVDKSLPGEKQEYVSSATLYIKKVLQLQRLKDGGIAAEGTIVKETLYELCAADTDIPKDGMVRENIVRHKIKGYYQHMDEIFEALARLKA